MTRIRAVSLIRYGIATLLLLSAATAGAQRPATIDTTGYLHIRGDTIIAIKPPSTPMLPTDGLPDAIIDDVMSVLLVDTLRILLQGDSAVTLSPVPGIPLSREALESLRAWARFENRHKVRQP